MMATTTLAMSRERRGAPSESVDPRIIPIAQRSIHQARPVRLERASHANAKGHPSRRRSPVRPLRGPVLRALLIPASRLKVMTATRAAASTPQAVQLSGFAPPPARALACKLRPKAVPKSPSMGRRRSARWPKEGSAASTRHACQPSQTVCLPRLLLAHKIQHQFLRGRVALDAGLYELLESWRPTIGFARHKSKHRETWLAAP